MDPEQIGQLSGAVTKLATAHKALKDDLDKIRSEISPQVKELPAVQAKLAEVEKAYTEKSQTLEGQIKELQDLVGKCTKALAALGGDGGGNSPLTRLDPGYQRLSGPQQHRRYMPNATAAKAMALFVHAVVSKSAKAIEGLEKLGVKLASVSDVERAGEVTDDELGGYLLPPEFGGVIITAMQEYGVAPQYCDVETMASKEKVFAIDGNDVEVQALEEGGAIAEKNAAFAQRTLVAKLFGAFTRWSADFDEYAAANQGEMWTRRFSRAIAKKIDQCVFLGDGTQTYNNLVGIMNDAGATVKSLAAGKVAFSDVGYDDLIGLFASVPDEVYQEGNCRLFGSANLMWTLKSIKDGVGRPIFTDARSGSTQILGEDYVRTATFPRISQSGAGTKFLGFGDLRRAMKLGIRTRMVLAFSPHAFFTNGQNALRVLARFGNKSSEANAFSLLKTADA